MINVVLCDDHAVLRRGIRDTLMEAHDITVTGEAGSYPELREVLRTSPCDVLLLDLNMPGRSGLEVLASLKETNSEIKVLIVSMYPEDQYALRCLKAGAQGYANKAGDPMELIAAVRTVVQGRKYLTAEVAQMLAESGGCTEFCVNGQSTAGASRPVRKHNEHQETRRTRRTAVWPAGQLQEA